MGTTAQERFLASLEALADKFSLIFEHNKDWANTGRVRLTPMDSFETVVEVCYDFQHTYCHIWASKGPLGTVVIGRNMNIDGMLIDRGNVSFDKLGDVLAEVKALIPR